MRAVPGCAVIIAAALAGCGSERAASSTLPVQPPVVAPAPVAPVPLAPAPIAIVPGPQALPAVIGPVVAPAPSPSSAGGQPKPAVATMGSVVGTGPGPMAIAVTGSQVGTQALGTPPRNPGGRSELAELVHRGLVAPELHALDPIYAGDLTPLVLPEGTTVDEWMRAPWSAVYRPLRLDCALSGGDARADPPPDGSLPPTAVVLAQSRGRRATMLATAPHERLPDPASLTACHTLGQLSALLGTAAPRETDSPGGLPQQGRRSHASWMLYTLDADGRVTVLVVDAVVTRSPEDGDWQVAELTVLGGNLSAMARGGAGGKSASAAADGGDGQK